jgi:exodeoxyribonuclease III
MKLSSWNVNGIRACGRNGFLKWFEKEKADVVCLQEVKATHDDLDEKHRNPSKYHAFWHPAEKAGYSGVAIYSKKEPLDVRYGIGDKEIDREGRVLVAKYPNFTLINAYFPNSQRDHARLPFKLTFCAKFLKYCESLKKKGENVLMCGDFNIAHKEIDLKNPKSNKDNAGFLPEDRAWMDTFLNSGYVDAFRKFNSDGGNYTWWSYRPGVREKNVGWRLDYFAANSDFADRLKSAAHRNDVMGSDHCPITIEIKK